MKAMITKKTNSKPGDSYFKVVTNREGDTPEMYLYGYIGQQAFALFDEDPEQDITDIAFIKAFRELEKDYKKINIRINSPGGSVMHGDPIITAIMASKTEVHTYVDGIAASMGFDIWLAGHKRHAAINSKLMVHNTGSIGMGTAKDLRQTADMLDKFDNSAIATFSAITGMDEAEVRERFYDYTDHWMTAKEAHEIGLIDKIDNYETRQVVENPEKMNFRQLLALAARVAPPDDEPEPEPVDGYENEKWREDYLSRLQTL